MQSALGLPNIVGYILNIMSLIIDASTLHPSTRLALAALSWLEERIQPQKVLDLGCGNGVLSLTAAHIWNARVIACDISSNAVADCTENARTHAPEGDIRVLRSDGFKHPTIAAEAPYGLIIGNLLAQWQVQMAGDIAKNLHPEGVILLSGILLWQEEGLIAAFKSLNIEVIQKFSENEWVCHIARHHSFTQL